MMTVENQTELQPEDILHRYWVTMREAGKDMFKRRSVIVRKGRNDLVVRWRGAPTCTLDDAALFMRPDDRHPVVVGKMTNPHPIKAAAQDTVTMSWRVDLHS